LKRRDDILIGNESGYGRFDTYLTSPGHLLIIPKRHILSIFKAESIEITCQWELVRSTKEYLKKKYSPDGYNIRINDGP